MKFRTMMDKHGSTIATVAAAVLTVAAVFFAVKSAEKGAKNAEKHQVDVDAAGDNSQLKTEADVKYIKNTIVDYKEAIICATGAIVMACISRGKDAKKIANLGAALAFDEDKIKKLYSYIEGKVGSKNKKYIEKDIAENDEDLPFDSPIKAKRRYKKEDIATFYESYSGTLFDSSFKDFYAACDRAELISSKPNGELGYNKWRALLGLEDIPAGACVGWPKNEFKAYTQESIIDGRTVYVIGYKQNPDSNYWK